MNKKLTVLSLALIASLSACASQPEDIAATDIGDGIYRNHSCEQLSERELHYQQQLEALSANQRSAATGDAWGVFLLGLPLSSMSGNDREAEIAVSRGHLNEIEREQVRKSCS
ncbi:hypothetical protein C2I36_00595 [Rhodobacteraceae bacterium WD3A24]|nr:hypothetical protein C2I36_00595 [Rhodobacteraceae bacterium WD3A24]